MSTTDPGTAPGTTDPAPDPGPDSYWGNYGDSGTTDNGDTGGTTSGTDAPAHNPQVNPNSGNTGTAESNSGSYWDNTPTAPSGGNSAPNYEFNTEGTPMVEPMPATGELPNNTADSSAGFAD